jgi:hypothetical protein
MSGILVFSYQLSAVSSPITYQLSAVSNQLRDTAMP